MFWDIRLRNSLKVNQFLGITGHLYLQGRRISPERKQQQAASKNALLHNSQLEEARTLYVPIRLREK
jgi:hypothetical protein